LELPLVRLRLPRCRCAPTIKREAFLKQFGGYGLSASSDNQQGMQREPSGMRRTATSPRASGDIYGAFTEGGAYRRTCSYVGGPKSSTWVCR
jgi:hypothetical protein